ncbi:MAG: class I SAM-dependent methyltransferase [Planctomycetota bacterium]
MNTNSAHTTLRSSAEVSTESRGCRFCNTPLEDVVVDLGMSPLCQSQIEKEALNRAEVFYPLRAFVCRSCWLVQVHEHVSGEDIFSHYAYFSSFSDSWLEHCRSYCEYIIQRLSLDRSSFVVEVAANDGYLLQNFVASRIPCLGVEPATNVAQKAMKKGVPVINEFFGEETAKNVVTLHGKADLVIANNVLAHVPDLNDFVLGLSIVLAEGGTLTVEFPHLLNLIELNQFDTIYQEHYCYFSLLTLQKVFGAVGMRIYDVETIPTHGGSLRIFVCHNGNEQLETRKAVEQIRSREIDGGLTELATYEAFADRVRQLKWRLVEVLAGLKRDGKRICAYGAPGKGNTLLNYGGIREDLVAFTVDRNPFKQGSFLVGSRIPVYEPEVIKEYQPDYVLILPWNLKEEIMGQLSYIREWGGKFIVPVPQVEIVE